jgi:hypothetical protein
MPQIGRGFEKYQVLKKRETGENIYQLLPVEPETVRGFNRLPAPSPGRVQVLF